LVAAQKAIISLFESKGVPLTLGLIANDVGIAPNLDPNNMVTPISQAILNATTSKCFKLELAFSGLTGEDFTTLDEPTQASHLNTGSQRIQVLFGAKPTTLLPEFNKFNSLTLQALNQSGFTTLSAEIDVDPGPFDYSNRVYGIYRFPVGAGTGEWNVPGANSFTGVPAAISFNQIVNQVDSSGWSVVLLNPETFSYEYSNGTYSSTLVNTTQLAELSNLIDLIRFNGYRLSNVGSLQNNFGNTNRDTCLGPPTTGSVTTGIPTTGVPTTGVPTTGIPTTGAIPTTVLTTNAGTSSASVATTAASSAATTSVPVTSATSHATSNAASTVVSSTVAQNTTDQTTRDTIVPVVQNSAALLGFSGILTVLAFLFQF